MSVVDNSLNTTLDSSWKHIFVVDQTTNATIQKNTNISLESTTLINKKLSNIKITNEKK